MPRIRCKFNIASVTRDIGSGCLTVHATAVWDNKSENREFSDATPWGHLHFGVSNKAAMPAFEEGGELSAGRAFYLDLTPAE